MRKKTRKKKAHGFSYSDSDVRTSLKSLPGSRDGNVDTLSKGGDSKGDGDKD